LSEQRKYRSWRAQQKLEIVLAGLRGDRSVREVCREHGISETLYYGWRDQLLEAGRERFAGKEERQGERELRRKIAELERTLGKKTYELERLSRKCCAGGVAARERCAGSSRSLGLEWRAAGYAARAGWRQSLSRLCVAQISRHSLWQASRPRRRKRSARLVTFVCPKTGSASSRRAA